MILGIWVLLPQPVAPMINVTRLSSILARMRSACSSTGSRDLSCKAVVASRGMRNEDCLLRCVTIAPPVSAAPTSSRGRRVRRELALDALTSVGVDRGFVSLFKGFTAVEASHFTDM